MEIKTKKSLCAFLHLYMRKMFLLVFLMLSIGSLSAHPIQAKFLACDRFASGMRVTYLLGCSVRCSEKQMLKSPVKLLI